jgi:acetoacetyl-CoA synthetase
MLLKSLMERNGMGNFRQLHTWSVKNSELFWSQAWDELGVIGHKGSPVRSGANFTGTKWFEEAKLNVVETLLAGDFEQEVLVELSEHAPRRALTRGQLRVEVAACAAALRASGVKKGDRVVAWMPNVQEAVVLALGALSLGAVVSTASTDFGPSALVDRFGQIEPVFLLTTAEYQYGGKKFSLLDKIDQVVSELPTLKQVVVVGGTGTHQSWEEFLAPHRGAELEFEKLDFAHPGFILFSSGTTGKPKCIVHSAAGVLLKVLSEQGYHLDINPGDRIFYSTTCGWMMWNWLVMALGRQATIVLVDGSPAYPEITKLWSVAEEEKLTFLGVSAALIDSWRKRALVPKSQFDLKNLKTIASTGSPLSPSGFDWVAESVSDSVALASIAGGTDVCGCLVLGVPTEKVVRGEIQGPALGLDIAIFDQDGKEVAQGEDGELVCKNDFPTVPLKFWGDDSGAKMRAAYFERFEGVWAHGDFARATSSGGFEILGRVDATLNSRGVRIGTAEIYRVVMNLPQISGALAVAQPFEGDTRIVLFVVTDEDLDQELIKIIKSSLRDNASPRHVPALIVSVPDLPKTRNGKLNELALADIISGKPERDSSTLANPECLDWFRQWAKDAQNAAR